MRFLTIFFISLQLLFSDTGWLINNATPRRVASWTVNSTYQNLTTIRYDARISNIVCPTADGDKKIIGSGSWSGNFPQFGIMLRKLSGVCYISGWNARDGIAGGEALASIPLGSRTDIYVRYQRDPIGGTFVADSQPRMLFQIWSATDASDKVTFGQSANPSIIGTVNQYSTIFTGPFSVGDDFSQFAADGTQVNVAWVKIYSTILGPGAPAPKACDVADIANYHFEGNGNNSSGSAGNLTTTNPSYTTTPNIVTSAPRTFNAPFWTNSLPFRAGFQNQLDATTSYSDELTCGMTYSWSQINSNKSPSILKFSSNTASQPTVDGALFGQYEINLTVTSPSGQKSTSPLIVGAVATDNNGVVINNSVIADKAIGQQMALGRSAWPYLDNRHLNLGNYFGQRLSNEYLPVWRTLYTGTVAVSFNSSTITGTGTSFSSVLNCQTSRDVGDFIVIRYADASVPSGYRYRASKAKICTDTSITLEFPWDGPTVSGASYGKFTMGNVGIWNGGGDNANYYDNVMAYYALYYRSGITAYRDYARELADRWVESPLRDYYASNGSGGYYYGDAPRVKALSGIIMRAADGRPDLWDHIWDTTMEGGGFGYNYKWTSLINAATWFGNRDPREEAYAMAHMALFAELNPNSTRSNTLRTVIDRYMTNMWIPLMRTEGGQHNYYTDRILGTATFTNNDTTVTTTGSFPADSCDFNATIGRSKRIWALAPGPIWENPSNDNTTYACTWVNSTTITLTTPYTGTTGVKPYSLEGINGPAVQPFMQGIVGRSMKYAFDSTGNSAAASHLQSTATYLTTAAYRASASAIYYILDARDPDCQRVPTNVFCVIDEAGSDAYARDFQAEIIGALSPALLANPSNTTLLNVGDILQGALYGSVGFGGPNTSNNYYSATIDIPTARNGKYFGFFFGFGGGTTWDAARVGGATSAQPQTIRFSIGGAAGETAAPTISFTSSTSKETISTCTANGSNWNCTYTGDKRTEDTIYFQIIRTFSNGQARSEKSPFKI